MQPEYYKALQALSSGVVFLPGSWDKRFVRSLSGLGPDDSLTPKQEEQIERIAVRFRKQLARRGYRVPLAWQQAVAIREHGLTAESLRNYWVNWDAKESGHEAHPDD